MLHTCCGPCFLGVWEDLKDSHLEVTNFFYNPNIWPESEYQLRKKNLIKVVKDVKTNFVEGPYQPEQHDEAIMGKENEFPGRCLDCYRLRLEETAKFAKENGFDSFSTTLLVSPYQNHDALVKIGNDLANIHQVNFYVAEWRPFFIQGQKVAREQGIYRQKYCGCMYSLLE